MSIARTAVLVATLAVASLSFAGCQSDSAVAKSGEKPVDKMDKSELMMRSDQLMAEGQMNKDDGMRMKQQGKAEGGDKLMMQGDKKLEDAKMLKDKAMAM